MKHLLYARFFIVDFYKMLSTNGLQTMIY